MSNQATVNPTVALHRPPCVVVNQHAVSPARGISTVVLHWFARVIRVNAPCAFPTQMKRTKSWFEVIRAITTAAATLMQPFARTGVVGSVMKMQIAIEARAS